MNPLMPTHEQLMNPAAKKKRKYAPRSSVPQSWLLEPSYTPHMLINYAAAFLGAKSDGDLAKILPYDEGSLHRVRHRKVLVSANFMVAIMDRTGWSLAYVRELAGLPFMERRPK